MIARVLPVKTIKNLKIRYPTGKITLVKIDRTQIKLGIEAPKDVTINREEVYKKDQVGNMLSSNSGGINHIKEHLS